MTVAKVDSKEAFYGCKLPVVHNALSECTDKKAEVDLLARGHHGAQCRVELEGLQIPVFTRSLGLQPRRGSSPGLFVTLVERLLWAQSDAEAAERDWGVDVDGQRTPRISRADENLFTASNYVMLRCMLRRTHQLLESCGMATDWGDPDNCAWKSGNDGDPDHIDAGRGAIRRVPETHILTESSTSYTSKKERDQTAYSRRGVPFGRTAAR